jgi:hypothetical protein
MDEDVVRSNEEDNQYHCKPNISIHVLHVFVRVIEDISAKKLIINTKISTCKVPASSNFVDDIIVVTSVTRGGKILDITPKYKESNSILALSRSSL